MLLTISSKIRNPQGWMDEFCNHCIGFLEDLSNIVWGVERLVIRYHTTGFDSVLPVRFFIYVAKISKTKEANAMNHKISVM